MLIKIVMALSVLKIIAAKIGKEVEGSDYYVSGIGGLKESNMGQCLDGCIVLMVLPLIWQQLNTI